MLQQLRKMPQTVIRSMARPTKVYLSVLPRQLLYPAAATRISDIFLIEKRKKKHGDQGILVGQFPLASDFVVMVDDVITDGQTKIESVELIRKLCKVKFSGVLVALDRMEKNSQANDAITEFQQKTGVPVWSIINIRETCDYLKNRKIDGSVVLEDSIFLKIENYLAEHCI